MLIPEAYRERRRDGGRRDWYDFHASLVEPWDGPALVAATDGDRIGAVLDRNGLRPCRYEVTTHAVIVAHEVGALDTDPAELESRGRLQPGEIFMADPDEGRVIPDAEVFDSLTDDKYGEWVAEEQAPSTRSPPRRHAPRDPATHSGASRPCSATRTTSSTT